MRKFTIIVGVAVAFFAASSLHADEFSKVGTSGAQFLKIGVGARYTAMGEASVANVSDAYALYWNPAALGGITQSHLEFTNIAYVSNVNLNYVAFAKPLSFGSIGASVTALTSGDMEITTVEEPNGTGRMFSTSSYAITLGYARQWTEFFSFGMSAKYITERISEERASGIAFDFGTLLQPGYRNLRIGMNISNLGPEMKYSGPELNFNYNPSGDNKSVDNAKGVLDVDSYDLPLVFRIGAAYDIQYSPSTRLTFSVEARDPSDNEQQGSFGAEAAFQETFFLRGGWQLNQEEQSATVGAGLALKVWSSTDLSMNYAFADFGRLNSVHRFSFGLRF